MPLDEVWPEPDASALRGEETALNVWKFSLFWFWVEEVVVTTGESAMAVAAAAVWRSCEWYGEFCDVWGEMRGDVGQLLGWAVR